MGIAEIIAIVSLVLTLFAFPAMWAVHKHHTIVIINEERPSLLTAAEQSSLKNIDAAMEKEARSRKSAIEEERERSKELFAAKHEMSEMRGLVNQLVHNTTKLDEKLDRMHELLLQLAKSR